MDTSGEREGGRGKIECGVKRYKQLCIKYISNKDTFYSTGKYSYYFAITLNGVYKNVESLCYTTETSDVNQLYFNI